MVYLHCWIRTPTPNPLAILYFTESNSDSYPDTDPQLLLYPIVGFGIRIRDVNVIGLEITFLSEEHVVEDDVLFTNHLVGK